MEHLNEGLRGVWGDDLLDALVEQAAWPVLHAMWLADSHELCGRLLARVVRGPDQVVDLLVEELETRRYADVFAAPTVVAHLIDADARCTADAAGRLLGCLDAEDPPPSIVETRGELLRWLLRHDHPEAENRAVDICGLQSADSDSDIIRAEAEHRVARSDPEVRQRVLHGIAALTEFSDVTWARAAQMGAIVFDVHGDEPGVKELAVRLVRDVGGHTIAEIPQSSARFLHLHASETILEVLAGDAFDAVADSGALALVATIPLNADRLWQLKAAETVAKHQPGLWIHHYQGLAASWDAESWRTVLDVWPTRFARSEIPEFGGLVGLAEPDFDLPALIWFVTKLEPVEAAGTLDVVAERLRAQVDVERAGENIDGASVLDSIRWPDVGDTESIARLEHLLVLALTSVDARAAVVDAYNAGRIGSALAAHLASNGPWAEMIARATAGSLRIELLDAVIVRHGESALVEFVELLAGTRDLDVVEALTRHSVTAAFAQVAEWWDVLDDAERDRVVDLLAVRATTEQLHLIDTIVIDTSRSNKARRMTAARLWGDLAERGGSVPPGITKLLDSPIPELVDAGISAIATARTRDEQTLRDLRDKAMSEGVAGTAARRALDQIETDVAAELIDLSAGPDLRANGPELCRLLGVVAGPQSFALLCSHLGPAARDEDLTLRRAAADALADCCAARIVEPEELITLGDLLHGEQGVTFEPDMEARRGLERAYRRAELGDDAAVALLDDVLGPSHRLAEFVPAGEEKRRLIEALKGMANRAALGEPGVEGYVQNLDLVLERVARSAYLAVGNSDNLKQLIRSDPTEPAYGNVINALTATVANAAVEHLQIVHSLRSNKTDAHGGTLTAEDVRNAASAFETSLQILHQLMVETGPAPLRSVTSASDATA